MKSQLILLSLAYFTTVFCANSQTMVKEMENANTRFIPGAFMKNGEAAIYFSENEYGYSDGGTNYEAQIFDFNLNPLKSFYFEILHPYTVTKERKPTGSIIKTKTITKERSLVSGIPPVSDSDASSSASEMDARKTAFINWFYDNNKYLDPTLSIDDLTSNCHSEGSTIYISLKIQPGGYYDYPEYLTKIETYLDASDVWGFRYTYSTQTQKYDGEWITTTWYDAPVSNFRTPRCVDVANMNHWHGGVYLPFSQTFFNDDIKFEYVRYNAEIRETKGITASSDNVYNNAAEYLFGITSTDRDGDGEEDFSQKYFGVSYNGLEVVTDDGTVIYSFPMPENCDKIQSVEFFKSDNCILAQVDFHRYDEENDYVYTTRFYRIDKSAGVVKVIRDENHISASPNPVNHGLPITITIPAGNQSPRSIAVTSLNGKCLYSTSVTPGVTEVNIPTYDFNPGMYIFTLKENDTNIESYKIIVQ